MSKEGSSKNYQSLSKIKEMYEFHFKKDSTNLMVRKLSGGLKNAVYLLENGEEKIVLKISPLDETKMISADRGIFWWEAKMLEKMEKMNFPAPRLLAYDDTHLICDSSYIFMTYVDGKNYLEEKEKGALSKEEITNIEHELGVLSKKITNIKGDNFFFPSQPNKKFKDNYEFVLNMFQLLLNDAITYGVDLSDEVYSIILGIIHSKKESLNNIDGVSLTHTDIWDGNVLVKNGKVTGIVDFADVYFCDEILTFYFHTIDGITSEFFLDGYGKTLSYDEKVRIEIYRMYVILKMIVDCKLKQYGRFEWMYKNLDVRIKELTK